MIHLLWPTVRPIMMKQTHQHWLASSSGRNKIITYIAVNTSEQREQLKEFTNVITVGSEHPGPAWPTYQLTKGLPGEKKDIVILASDDFFSPKDWDSWLIEIFKDYDGGIMVNDGYQLGACITIPILSFGCLLRLNRYLYHPAYNWQYSDAELCQNLKDLNLFKDLRKPGLPVFEHRHWANMRRKYDEVDKTGADHQGKDKETYDKRMAMKVEERLR